MTANDLILKMKASWDKTSAPVKWILSFTRLGQFFNASNPQEHFIEIYLSSFFLTRWLFKIFFVEDRVFFDNLISACQILKDKYLLKPKIVSDLFNHPDLSSVSSIILSFNNWNLELITTCLKHSDPQSLIDTIAFLKKEGMGSIEQVFINHDYADAAIYFSQTQNALILEKKQTILSTPDLAQNIKIFRELEKHQLLTSKIIDTILLLEMNPKVSEVIAYLSDANLLNEERLQQILGINPNSARKSSKSIFKNLDSLAFILLNLQSLNMLNELNYQRVLERDADALVTVIQSLSNNKLLNQEIFETILAHQETEYVSDILLGLHQTGLLTSENIQTVREKFKNVFHSTCINLLIDDNLLDQVYFEATFNAVYPESFITALVYFQENHLQITPHILQHLVMHPSPEELARGIHVLFNEGLLTDEYITIIAELKSSYHLAMILGFLHASDILTPENIQGLVQYQQTLQNIQGLVQYQQTPTLMFVVQVLYESGLLNQDNFMVILNPDYLVLLKAVVYHHLLRRLTAQQLFQNWQAILFIARQPDAEIALINFAHQTFLEQDFQEAQAGTLVINDAQSTHTASIHETVSLSAQNLMQRYGHRLPDEQQTIFTILLDMIQKLPDNFLNQRVKACIKRLLALDEPYIDPVSYINVHQLIALVFMAIQDDELLIGSLSDALEELYQGLFEIERGINLNEPNVFNPAILDAPICPGGTINKIVNRLQGRHPDVELIFMTMQTATLKFMKLVELEAVNYLWSLPSPQNIAEFIQFTDLMKDIEVNGLEIIWDKIEDKVKHLLFDEFNLIFTDGMDSTKFSDLIAQGVYVKLKDIHCMQEKLEHSPGYQAYCKQHLSQDSKLLENSLWSMRHCSANHQHEFDKKMGLTIFNR